MQQLKEGGNIWKRGDQHIAGRIHRENIGDILKTLDTWLSKVSLNGKRGQPGLRDMLLGSSAQARNSNPDVFGKTETVGDIDIAISPNLYSSTELENELRSRLNRRYEEFGIDRAEQGIDRDVVINNKGLGTVSILYPISGNPQPQYVQIDFMSGDPHWMTWAYMSPDPELGSSYKGLYRNVLLADTASHYRFYVSDYAWAGLIYSTQNGLYVGYKHRAEKKTGQGRVKSFSELPADEWMLAYGTQLSSEDRKRLKDYQNSITTPIQDPRQILKLLFPKRTPKPHEVESYEQVKQAVEKNFEPAIATDILKKFARSMERMKMEVPKDLEYLLVDHVDPIPAIKPNQFESFAEYARQWVLTETSKLSHEMLVESICRRSNFESWRSNCHKVLDQCNGVNVCVWPKKGKVHAMEPIQTYTLIKDVGMMGELKKMQNQNWGNNPEYRTRSKIEFCREVVDLLDAERIEKATGCENVEKIGMTPEAMVHSLAGVLVS